MFIFVNSLSIIATGSGIRIQLQETRSMRRVQIRNTGLYKLCLGITWWRRSTRAWRGVTCLAAPRTALPPPSPGPANTVARSKQAFTATIGKNHGQIGTFHQCSGSGSTGSTCFWASWIRIHKSEVWIRIRLWIRIRILLSSCKIVWKSWFLQFCDFFEFFFYFIFSIAVLGILKWPGVWHNLFGSGRQQRSGWIRPGSYPRQCRAYLIFFFTFVPGPSLFTKTQSESCTLPKASQSQGKFSSFLVHIRDVLASLPSFSDKLPNKRVVRAENPGVVVIKSSSSR